MDSPSLTLVNKVESSGWRATAEGILETHIVLANDVVKLSWTAFKNDKISFRTYLFVRFCYTHAMLFLIYKGILKKDFWGRWQLSGIRKLSYLFKSCMKVVLMPPFRYLNLLVIVAVFIHVMRYHTMRFYNHYLHADNSIC
jgi:hypothetical protein